MRRPVPTPLGVVRSHSILSEPVEVETLGAAGNETARSKRLRLRQVTNLQPAIQGALTCAPRSTDLTQ